MLNYNSREIMAIMAGRMVSSGNVLFCGTGLSLIAATLAKKLYAPDCILFFETGSIDAELAEMPLAVADPRVMYASSINAGLMESFSILGHKKVLSKAFLGAAQIDKYGNLNTTCIGNYFKPAVRFPGSGGGCDASCLANEVIIFMEHKKIRFVDHLDYFTSPGWISECGTREKIGLRRGGPSAVVTDLGIMKFDEDTKVMYVNQIHTGVTREQIVTNTGFEIDVSRATESAPVTPEELDMLRNEIDPQKIII